MTESEKRELMDEITYNMNAILDKAFNKNADAMDKHSNSIQKYVRESVTPMVEQTLKNAEIDKERYENSVKRDLENIERVREAEVERMLQIKVHNACILFATEFHTKEECVSIIQAFEDMFRTS